MTHHRRRVALAAVAALLALTAPIAGANAARPAATASLTADRPFEPCPHADGVKPTSAASPPTVAQPYFLNDWRLGPQPLPTSRPLNVILRGYRRLDHLPGPGAFFASCWQTLTGGGNWWYPKNNGFLTSRRVRLALHQRLDRFGSNFGSFLAPAGSSFAGRALPPSSLDTFDPKYPNNYHAFQVLKPFSVDAGPARPWFGQPGRGLQYMVNGAYLPGAPTGVNVAYLLAHGYLRALN